jgi:hypothetical protein
MIRGTVARCSATEAYYPLKNQREKYGLCTFCASPFISRSQKLKTVFLQKVEASAGEIYRTAVQRCICGELKNSSNDPMMILNSFEMRQ